MALSKEARENRRIGGSSSSAVMGLSKYKRPEELRREISYSMHGREAIEKWVAPALSITDTTILPAELSGELEAAIDKEEARLNEDIDSIHTRVGVFLEAFVRERLKGMGINVRVKNEYMIHPDYPFITANIDGRESDTVEEIKCISVYRKGEFGDEYTDECAPDYAAQIHHYLLFPQFKTGRLRVLFLTPSEKELVDRMVKTHILKHTSDKLDQEVMVPRFGAVTMTAEKMEEYAESGLCSMNLDVIQNIVDIAPLKTYEFHKEESVSEKLITEYKDLWHRAEHNIPCIPTTIEDCQILYEGYSSGTSKIAGDLEKRLCAERDIIVARMKTDKDRLPKIMAELMIEAGDTNIVLGAGGKALFKIGQKFSPSKDEGVLVEEMDAKVLQDYYKPVPDWKGVEKDYPDIYARCRIKSARNIVWPRKK